MFLPLHNYSDSVELACPRPECDDGALVSLGNSVVVDMPGETKDYWFPEVHITLHCTSCREDVRLQVRLNGTDMPCRSSLYFVKDFGDDYPDAVRSRRQLQ